MPKKFDDVDTLFAEGMFSTIGISMSFKNFFYNLQPDLVCVWCMSSTSYLDTGLDLHKYHGVFLRFGTKYFRC